MLTIWYGNIMQRIRRNLRLCHYWTCASRKHRRGLNQRNKCFSHAVQWCHVGTGHTLYRPFLHARQGDKRSFSTYWRKKSLPSLSLSLSLSLFLGSLYLGLHCPPLSKEISCFSTLLFRLLSFPTHRNTTVTYNTNSRAIDTVTQYSAIDRISLYPVPTIHSCAHHS